MTTKSKSERNSIPAHLREAIAQYEAIRQQGKVMQQKVDALSAEEDALASKRRKALCDLIHAFDHSKVAAVKIGTTVYRRPDNILDDTDAVIENVID